MPGDLYRDRLLSEGYPGLESAGVDYHAGHHEAGSALTRGYLDCVRRLIDLDAHPSALVVGCGPRPHAINELREAGLDVTGLEPVAGIAAEARAFLGDDSVKAGAAEAMPFGDQSFGMVWMTSVMEHVDSPELALSEAHRVLRPGGVLFVYTTNRTKVSLRGFNGEYSIRFFNWLPKLVQESYVFNQLHYRPEIANHNARPAVHWFTYASLCRLGRGAGFGQFYSWLDRATEANPLASSPIRKRMLAHTSSRPWVRAAALTQAGGCVFMLKRR